VRLLFLSSFPSLLLIYHGYYLCPAFADTNTTPLAVKQIGFKIALRVLPDTTLRAKYLADATFYAPVKIIGRSL